MVAKMTQMRHDIVSKALRLVVCACSSQSLAETRNRAPGLVGIMSLLQCQRLDNIMAVLPRIKIAAVDVVATHASATLYAAQAANETEWTAATAEY